MRKFFRRHQKLLNLILVAIVAFVALVGVSASAPEPVDAVNDMLMKQGWKITYDGGVPRVWIAHYGDYYDRCYNLQYVDPWWMHWPWAAHIHNVPTYNSGGVYFEVPWSWIYSNEMYREWSNYRAGCWP